MQLSQDKELFFFLFSKKKQSVQSENQTVEEALQTPTGGLVIS